MMVFIFGYLLPMFIMGTIFGVVLYKDRSITYGGLLVVLALVFVPFLNVFALLGAVIAGLSFVWDEYSDRPVFK